MIRPLSRTIEVVTPPDLREGDIIIQHSGIFRVLMHTNQQSTAIGGWVGVNVCEFLANVKGKECQIPESWRFGWNCQGNNLVLVQRYIGGDWHEIAG